jgi:uncharacterized membrane protein HdeD (DUF308 family)
VVTGAIELAGARALNARARGTMVTGDRLLGLNGLVSLVFGLVLLFETTIGAGLLMVLLGGFALISGILLLAFAINVKTWRSVLGSPVVAL